MDVSIYDADAGSLHLPACARRSCFPPGSLGFQGAECDLLCPLRSDVPPLPAHPDVFEANPPDNGQHVQLCAADRCLVHRRHGRPRHLFLAEIPVGNPGLYRCLPRDTEQKQGRHRPRTEIRGIKPIGNREIKLRKQLSYYHNFKYIY